MSAQKASKLADALHDIADDMADEVEDELEDGAEDARVEAQRELVENDSVAHGNLISSFLTDDTVPDLPTGEVGAMTAATMPYSAYVEYGTGIYNTQRDATKSYKSPGNMGFYGNIYQWVIRKGLTPDEPVEFTFDNVPRPSMMHIAEQQKLAYRITQVIHELGNRPHPFMRPAYRRRKPTILDNVTRTVDDVYSW